MKMKKVTVAVIGGYHGKAILNQGKKLGVDVIHHDGLSHRKKEMYNIVKKADSVVIILNTCGHTAQDFIKEACKESNTPIVFSKSSGASSVIRQAMNCVSVAA
ncbi:DUF2325 domain-containing protein [Butyricicoccus sp. 1XD8-22]|nr:DUF2325 domain-containing protein [Butyricicoccus sp. 1XD8-22]